MKLGKDTKSVNSWIMGNAKQIEPTVGMGATLLAWSDRYAGTIIKIEKDKQGRQIITVQEDNHNLLSEYYSDNQEWEHTPNPNGSISYFRFNKEKWEKVTYNEVTRRWKKDGTQGILIGQRNHFDDPGF